MLCPICKKPVKLEDPFMPFCSERCKLLDLGNWASEFGFTQSELGTITGGGLAGFGVTIIVLSFVADKIGYGPLMALAFVPCGARALLGERRQAQGQAREHGGLEGVANETAGHQNLLSGWDGASFKPAGKGLLCFA